MTTKALSREIPGVLVVDVPPMSGAAARMSVSRCCSDHDDDVDSVSRARARACVCVCVCVGPPTYKLVRQPPSGALDSGYVRVVAIVSVSPGPVSDMLVEHSIDDKISCLRQLAPMYVCRVFHPPCRCEAFPLPPSSPLPFPFPSP